MDHFAEAEKMVKEVHDPAAAAIVHALLALADALVEPPPEEPEPEPEPQTAANWNWKV